MSNKFIDLIKEKLAETKKQREQDKGKAAPDFQINREPESEPVSESEQAKEKPVKH
jgi:hypothetical protein